MAAQALYKSKFIDHRLNSLHFKFHSLSPAMMVPHILSIVLAIIACAAAKPSGIVPVLGPGIVTAHSNQVVARTYNGIVTPTVSLLPPLAAPAPRFYPIATTPTYVPTYAGGYYPYTPVYRYDHGYTYPWGAYGPTVVRYPATTYW